MKINNLKEKEVLIDVEDILYGECFMYGGDLFLLFDEDCLIDDENFYAIRLEDGELVAFNPQDKVLPVRTEINVYNK